MASTISNLGQQAATAAVATAKNGGLTPQQNELCQAITDGLKPLTTKEVNAALAELERKRPQMDYAQVSGVELKAPPFGNGDADPNTYTRMGLFETPPNAVAKTKFMLSLYDAKGQPPSGDTPDDGGPSRLIPLDNNALRAVIRGNNLGDVSSAFTRLFEGMAQGESAVGWNAK